MGWGKPNATVQGIGTPLYKRKASRNSFLLLPFYVPLSFLYLRIHCSFIENVWFFAVILWFLKLIRWYGRGVCHECDLFLYLHIYCLLFFIDLLTLSLTFIFNLSFNCFNRKLIWINQLPMVMPDYQCLWSGPSWFLFVILLCLGFRSPLSPLHCFITVHLIICMSL